MKDKELIAKLENEKQQLVEQVNGLTRRVEELEGQKKPSKSRTIAEAGLELLRKGPASVDQFAKLNQKYPADVAYYIRTLLKQEVKTVRTQAGTLYMLPEHFEEHQANLLKAKAVAAEAKEELQQAPPSKSPEAVHATA
jgi:hypothetical protein